LTGGTDPEAMLNIGIIGQSKTQSRSLPQKANFMTGFIDSNIRDCISTGLP
jgi:hypothetical protein